MYTQERYFSNRFLVIIYDLIMIPVAWWASFCLRYNTVHLSTDTVPFVVEMLPIVFSCQALAFWWFGLYRGIWRFASLPDLMRILKAVMTSQAAVLLCLFLWNRLIFYPRSIIILDACLLLLSLGGARLLIRAIKNKPTLLNQEVQRLLIVGAGQAGESLLRTLSASSKQRGATILVDDNKRKIGQEVHGIRVMGTVTDIPSLCKRFQIDLIIIAIPSASSTQISHILKQCQGLNIPVRTLPALSDIVAGRISIDLLRSVSLEDLLGREQVALDWQGIRNALQNKIVLVTGAGGSIGAELCRQIAMLEPKVLIMLDHAEYNLFKIVEEISNCFPKIRYHRYLGDVVDSALIDKVFRSYTIDVVFHAAAYKHVPMLENQVRASVKGNIIGTQVVAKAAVQYKTHQFILVSSDKAVNPSSIMGATKRAAEIVCHIENCQGVTKFSVVRFGNVLNSAGSVVPIFKEQILQGGPVTVTHPEMSRFFMTIPEACQLILQSVSLSIGGEILVLDMGDPIKIKDLAEKMIQLSGKIPGKDIYIKYIGLRPGEKLQEELFYHYEKLHQTEHQKIFKASCQDISVREAKDIIFEMQMAVDRCDDFKLKELLKKLVPYLAQQVIHQNLEKSKINHERKATYESISE